MQEVTNRRRGGQFHESVILAPVSSAPPDIGVDPPAAVTIYLAKRDLASRAGRAFLARSGETFRQDSTRQSAATSPHTANPSASGSSAETAVHLALPVSL